MEENNDANAEVTPTEEIGGENNIQGKDTNQKLFTQEEVNKFVQGRISRLKGQINKDSEAEYTKKMQELQAREMKLLVKESLSDRGMPKELSDIISCTDEEDLNNKLDTLQKIYGKEKEEKSKGFVRIGANGEDENISSDPVRLAMGLD